MPRFRVEVWEVQSWDLYVDAPSHREAQAEAERILEEHSPESWGAKRSDNWVDVMDAEEM